MNILAYLGNCRHGIIVFKLKYDYEILENTDESVDYSEICLRKGNLQTLKSSLVN